MTVTVARAGKWENYHGFGYRSADRRASVWRTDDGRWAFRLTRWVSKGPIFGFPHPRRRDEGGGKEDGEEEMNYDEMPAGRELDAIIAEKVIGENIEHRPDRPDEDVTACLHCGYYDADPDRPEFCIPNYSTDIATAWKVVERLYPKTVVITLSGISVYADDLCQVFGHDGKVISEGRGATTPLAICRAAVGIFKKTG